ncbi:high-affinity lysophosphatidic acid receptor-like [Oculina patagonica]
MTVNSSILQDSECFLIFQAANASKSSLVYYQVTITISVVTSLLAPMTVVGNALIMAAIWKNPSLGTPSYVLLAGLAFTDFCTGLLSQPFFVVYNLAGFTENISMFCIATVVAQSVACYFSTLTAFVMTIIAVERWLHMSRRSLLTVHRVVILFITFVVFLIPFVACYIYSRFNTNHTNYSVWRAVIVIFLLAAALCFILNVFAYFKVFRIIRHHQSQVQTNQNAIDIKKYQKSVFTILYILAISVTSYVPFVCSVLGGVITGADFRTASYLAVRNACVALLFSSSFFNPLLYYWRIKEIRDSVRNMVRKACCKENVEES